MSAAPAFDRYIGIDYSGAKTPISSLKGIRVFDADHLTSPIEAVPPPGARKYWTRRGVAEWLVTQCSLPTRALVGIDHGFSFPEAYFDRHCVSRDWNAFLTDVHEHWPTDDDRTWVRDVRRRLKEQDGARLGEPTWRRLTEVRCGTAKSLFHFDVRGSVAHSTHAGLPWLRYLRQNLKHRVHFWPFDGWEISDKKSAIVEVYPRLWNQGLIRTGFTRDQHDAYSVAEWLREADTDGRLVAGLNPSLTPTEREQAQIEGWILGVGAAS